MILPFALLALALLTSIPQEPKIFTQNQEQYRNKQFIHSTSSSRDMRSFRVI